MDNCAKFSRQLSGLSLALLISVGSALVSFGDRLGAQEMPGGEQRQGAAALPADVEKQRKQAERQQQQQLEQMKRLNPKLYEQMKRQVDRQENIARILRERSEGTLSTSQAEQQLFVLLNAQMQEALLQVDEQIVQTKRFLRSWSK